MIIMDKETYREIALMDIRELIIIVDILDEYFRNINYDTPITVILKGRYKKFKNSKFNKQLSIKYNKKMRGCYDRR